MKQGLIDPDYLCKQRWEGSGNDFPSIVQEGDISRQAVWEAHTRAWNPSSKSLCPSAFSLLCFCISILPFPTFPETPLVFTFLHCWRMSCIPGDKTAPRVRTPKCFLKPCLTQLHSAQLLLTFLFSFLILFLPSIPYPLPLPLIFIL